MDGDSAHAAYLCIAVDVEAVLGANGKAETEAAGSADAPIRPIAARSADVIATSTAQRHPVDITARLPNAIVMAARVGDLLRIYAISGSDNFEGAVLLEDVQALSRSDAADVLSAFELAAFEQIAVTPSAGPLCTGDVSTDAEFWFWQATIENAGTQQCHAVLALYDRDDQGQPRFAGLYRWDFKLTVTLMEASEQQSEGVV